MSQTTLLLRQWLKTNPWRNDSLPAMLVPDFDTDEDQEYTIGRVIFLNQLILSVLLELGDENTLKSVLGQMETFFAETKKVHHPDLAFVLAIQDCLEEFRGQANRYLDEQS